MILGFINTATQEHQAVSCLLIFLSDRRPSSLWFHFVSHLGNRRFEAKQSSRYSFGPHSYAFTELYGLSVIATIILGINRNSISESTRIIVNQGSCHFSRTSIHLTDLLQCLRYLAYGAWTSGRNAVSARQTLGATHHSTRLSFTRVDQFFSVHDKLSQVYYHLIWFQACTTLRLPYHLSYCSIQSSVFAFLPFASTLIGKFVVLAGYFSVFSFWVVITPRWEFLCCVIYRWRICLRWRGVEWACIGEILVLCFSVACSASAWCMSFITWSNLRDIYVQGNA